MNIPGEQLNTLNSKLSGELDFSLLTKRVYATDASAYREVPCAVAFPKTENDLIELVRFAHKNKVGLIPRTAGTSLAGQVVGNGIIVDFSRNMNQILEINEQEGWARVQPGVIRDELNFHLGKTGLFFAPETSTANRAMIGGMVGNNSCGANSIRFGSTRDHILELKTVLSDGSVHSFFQEEKNTKGNGLKSECIDSVLSLLKPQDVQKEIKSQFPKAEVSRRNTGYAIDLVIEQEPFNGAKPFSMIPLLAGSEGTLAMVSEIKVNLVPLPSPHRSLICVHFRDLFEALEASVEAMKYDPLGCELMDNYILECTKANINQQKNRFFVKGDPEAILVIEVDAENELELEKTIKRVISALKSKDLGYHYPVVSGEDIKKVWDLRKAGLGLLSNLPGDPKPVPVIEDTAVDVRDLPAYIREFNAVLKKYDLKAVHYAHAGAGELHLRPILDLKTSQGRKLFRTILAEVADLVKRFEGSLSGEHGDGRLRGEFIPKMIGEKNYDLLKKIKQIWDPSNIMNPGKIVDTPPMDRHLRYQDNHLTPEPETTFDFSKDQGFIRSAEKCNGSGDCRKLHFAGGTMCPSYMATKNEKDTTRARANALRDFYSYPDTSEKANHKAVKDAMDLCLSCKGCKSECPSNVDMAKLKAEWQQQSYDKYGAPIRSKLVARLPDGFKWGMMFPALANFFTKGIFGSTLKSILGFAQKRSLPKLSKESLYSWYIRQSPSLRNKSNASVFIYIDEFSNYLDLDQGKATISLLWELGYSVKALKPLNSGRSYLSKGFAKKAALIAEQNVNAYSKHIGPTCPLVGIEPSAILSFRDEYPDLVSKALKNEAKNLANHVYTIEEFLWNLKNEDKLKDSNFLPHSGKIMVHGHCHQKALTDNSKSAEVLSLIPNATVETIPSGCCGMAGSFGYEKKNFKLSMDIGELVLFPAVRKASEADIICASGTSCRHQIKDGTSKEALHFSQIIRKFLRTSN